MADTPATFISISKENFAEYQRQVYDYADSVCVGNTYLPHQHGLLSLVVTTATWHQLPNVANIDGVNFLHRDVLNPPLPPADNANAWRLFEYRTKEYTRKLSLRFLYLLVALRTLFHIQIEINCPIPFFARVGSHHWTLWNTFVLSMGR